MAWIEFDVTNGSTARHHARDELRALAHRRDVVERGFRCCPVQDGAAQQAEATVDLYPEGLRAYFALGHAELARGRHPEAVAAFEKALALEREITSLGSLGHAYGRAGRPDQARAVLAELHERSGQEEVPHYVPAMVHIGLGEHDVALALLEDAFAERDGRLFGIGTIPAFFPMRGDSRFEDLKRRLGLSGNTDR